MLNGEAPGGKCVFIDERKTGIGSGFTEFANAEAQQDALFHPDIHAPFAIDFFGGANFAFRELLAKLQEHLQSFRGAPDGFDRGEALDGRFQRMHEGESIKEPRMQKSECRSQNEEVRMKKSELRHGLNSSRSSAF